MTLGAIKTLLASQITCSFLREKQIDDVVISEQSHHGLLCLTFVSHARFYTLNLYNTDRFNQSQFEQMFAYATRNAQHHFRHLKTTKDVLNKIVGGRHESF